MVRADGSLYHTMPIIGVQKHRDPNTEVSYTTKSVVSVIAVYFTLSLVVILLLTFVYQIVKSLTHK